jgi:hypothetical protein
MSTATASPGRWYFGPLPDLLLGCGLGYAIFFVGLSLAGPQIRAGFPMGLLPLAILVTGVPHYGATLLRVYEHRQDRRAYAFFSLFASALVWVGFAVSLQNVLFGSLFLTLYLTWSPYHYTGQNYGIAMMFLRRRGVVVSKAAQRWVHASFLLSFGLTALAIHSVAVSVDYAPIQYEGTVYRLLPLGIPEGLGDLLTVGLGVAYAASLLGAGVHLLRVASLRDLVPAALLALTQALWFTVPVVGRHLGWYTGEDAMSVQNAAYTFMWIGMGHSLQYLWVTCYYAARSGDAPRRSVYLAKTLLAGAAIWVVPGILFAPGGIGSLPYDAGLAVMISSAVNLQHFVLDGAIWKLRDGRIAKILIRGAPEATSPTAEAARIRVAPLVWTAGALSVGVYVVGALALHGANEGIAARDLSQVERASQWLARIGRQSGEIAGNEALLLSQAGDASAAISRARAGLDLHETAEGQRRLGFLYESAGQPDEAAVAYRRALELQPEWPEVQNNLAWLLATHPNPSRAEREEAVALAESASQALGSASANALDTLAVAYAAVGRFEEATATAARALAIARRQGDAGTARPIAQRLALFRRGLPYPARP